MSDSFSALFKTAGLPSAPSSEQASLETPPVLRPFFDWCPTELEAHPQHTTSEKTRVPNPYDHHLHKDLRLKHVVHRPSITKDLANIAKKTSHRYISTHPDPEESMLFPNGVRVLSLADDRSEIDILDEDAISCLYLERFARHAVLVAATVECNFDSWQPGNFIIDKKPSCKASSVNADAFLKLSESARGNQLTAEKNLQPAFDIYRDFCAIEFKSVEAGDESKMRLVHQLHLLDEFPWHGCPTTDSCSIHNKLEVEGSRMGPDSLVPCVETRNATSCSMAAEDCLPETRLAGGTCKTPSDAVRRDAEYIMQQVCTVSFFNLSELMCILGLAECGRG